MHTVPHDLPHFFDAAAHQDLAWRGATLDERLAASSGRESFEPDQAARGRFARWARLFAGGDQAALFRRLAWDGLTPASAAGALSDQPPAGWTTSWTGALEALLVVARAAVHDYRSAEWEREIDELAGATSVPFADVWLPLVRFARVELLRATPAAARLARPAAAAFERQLAADLARAGGMVLFEAFDAFRHPGAAAGDHACYDGFVRSMLAGGLRRIFGEYPALGRRCVQLVEAWGGAQLELLARLEADASLIGDRFGRRIGVVSGAAAGLSDPHDGGRRVAVLQFEDGWRLVYKPRDLGLERAFNEFLGWCREAGLRDVPSPLEVIDRHGYGWMEFAERTSFAGTADVREYFRRAGGLLCIGYLLRSSDLHAENIVAACAGPAVVDGEVMVQPIRPSEGGGSASPEGHDGAADRDRIHNTCLASGLLSLRHRDPAGSYYEVGGLRESGARAATVARPAWSDLRSDAMRFTLVQEWAPRLTNVAEIDGRAQLPDEYAADVVGGFRRTYGFLLQQRDRLAASEGPLSGFRAQAARVLFRASDPYGALLEVMNAPRHWRSGVDRSLAFDSLNRPFSHQLERPSLWALAADERHDLEHGDIPRFTMPTDAAAPLSSSGESAPGHFSKAGHDAVLERLSAMSEEGLASQVAWIEGALPPLSRFERFVAPAIEAQDADPWRAAARRLGADILERATSLPGGGITWPVLGDRLDLYAGHAAIAVLFAALARVQGAEWRQAAHGVVNTIDGHLDAWLRRRPSPSDIVATLPSVLFALTVAAALLEERGALDRSQCLVAEFQEDRLAATRDFDVAGGLSGAILALVALHEVSGAPDALERASGCARLLASRQVATSTVGRAWRSPDGHLRAGFGHGASGAAYALARFSAVAGCRQAQAAAEAALDWEESVYSPADRNWPAVRGDGGASIMTGWCHGAAGIALARALWPRGVTSEARMQRELRHSVDATLSAPPALKDHLCCGALSRVEALLAASDTAGNPSWLDAAVRLARPIADRVAESGAAAARTGGFEYALFQPGFFQGVAGIGYQLLRVGHPRLLPSVAGFATPAWRP